MTTIGFFGDSFCASTNADSWCVVLSKKLGLDIIHWGIGGASIWNTILQFNRLTTKPNIIVFCWTEPNRLYHPRLPLTPNGVPIAGEDPKLFDAAKTYYKYLQNDDKDKLAYQYALQWFDQHELKKFADKHKIVQMWSFFPESIKLHTGKIVNESMVRFAWGGDTPNKDYHNDLLTSNHMCSDKNQQWADKIEALL